MDPAPIMGAGFFMLAKSLEPGFNSMLKTNHILLASHGTQGALAAVEMALTLVPEGGSIHHLTIVPEFWDGMMGDDWLNNASTRDKYADYLETALGREIDDHCEIVKKRAAARSIAYSRQIVVGKPDKCLVEYCQENSYDLVVLGAPRPKKVAGLRSRMSTEYVIKNLSIPLLTVPFPNE